MAARRTRFDERSFHAWLAAHLPAGRATPLPLGDDAAALRPRRGEVAIVTADALVEGTHFRRASPPAAIGAAAAAVNLSDLAAKGAQPAGLLLALLVPPATPRRWAEAVVLGAERTARAYGAHVVGGDTKASPRRAVVGTAIGWARPDRLAPRSGARPGDFLVTTGTVGRGGAAAARLGRRPDRRTLRDLLAITPRVAGGRALAPFVRAMLDTSDGLAAAAHLLAAASHVRVRLVEAALPFDPRVRDLPPARRRALAFFGGDYELLASLPPGRLRAARAAARAARLPLHVIGDVTAGRGAVLATDRGAIPLPAGGWDPFRPRRPPTARPPRRSPDVEPRAPPSQGRATLK